jgi:hypothetical protein
VLIVIRPGVQINAVEGDTLRANRNRRDVRTHVMVEAVLVHAEVSRCVTQSNEARQELRLRSVHGRHRAVQQNCGSDRLGMSYHSMPIMKREGKKVSQGFGTIYGRYSNGSAAHASMLAAADPTLHDVSAKKIAETYTSEAATGIGARSCGIGDGDASLQSHVRHGRRQVNTS